MYCPRLYPERAAGFVGRVRPSHGQPLQPEPAAAAAWTTTVFVDRASASMWVVDNLFVFCLRVCIYFVLVYNNMWMLDIYFKLKMKWHRVRKAPKCVRWRPNGRCVLVALCERWMAEQMYCESESLVFVLCECLKCVFNWNWIYVCFNKGSLYH